MGIAFCVEHYTQRFAPHHNYSHWSVLSMHVLSIIPESIVLGKTSGGHYLPNIVTAYGPAAESVSVQNPRFVCS